MSPVDKLLDQHYKEQSPSDTSILEEQLLIENQITRVQWEGFREMVRDMELNREGARLLLDEVINGRVILP